MNKAQIIEKALEPYIEKRGFYDGVDIDYDALAEQIMINCEVRQEPGLTYIAYGGLGASWRDWIVDGLQGTQGKAVAIILPLGKEQ